jgi:hypothetical protein
MDLGVQFGQPSDKGFVEIAKPGISIEVLPSPFSLSVVRIIRVIVGGFA